MSAEQADSRTADIPRVLIVAEHASARFGGEAALPLHYFRVLRRRGVPVWLITHARTRDELSAAVRRRPRIHYIEDTWLHRAMWRLGRRLPAAIAYFTTGFVSRLSTQLEQRRLVRRLVERERIDVVHQPMPVSPREPSTAATASACRCMIGPMNGGMDYPPAFRRQRGDRRAALLTRRPRERTAAEPADAGQAPRRDCCSSPTGAPARHCRGPAMHRVDRDGGERRRPEPLAGRPDRPGGMRRRR